MKDNFGKAINIFRKNYKVIPLELVGKEPFNNLVATFLSPRTRDEVTYEAFTRLYKKARNVKELALLSTKTIARLIYPVAFYQVKAKNLKETAKILLQKYDGQVPNNIEELTQLPGVGRKIANIVLAGSFGKNAIAVDTHVHRIANLLGWVNTKTPEKTETELNKALPKRYWREVNRLFVSIGRQYPSRKKLLEFLTQSGLLAKS